MAEDQTISALRAAIGVSPKNVPLRGHLANTLLGLGRREEGEKEWGEALAIGPEDMSAKTGLASAFFQQGKDSQAAVIVEDLTKRADAPAKAHVLHARLLLREGKEDAAQRQYRKALEKDPTA